jgi:hypothetical protein
MNAHATLVVSLLTAIDANRQSAERARLEREAANRRCIGAPCEARGREWIESRGLSSTHRTCSLCFRD